MKIELVTTLKRKATDILKEVKKTREPILITEHGRPSAYLVDVVSFENSKARIQLLEGIARGEEAIRQGRTISNKKAKVRLSKWLK